MTNSSSKQVEPPERIWIEVYREGYPVPTEFYANPIPNSIEYTRVPVDSTAPEAYHTALSIMVHEPTGALQCNDFRCPVGGTMEGWPHSLGAPDCIYHATVASPTLAWGNYYEQAITVNWAATNTRRHELITKKAGGLTDNEANELYALQWLAGMKRELGSGPPPGPKEEEAPAPTSEEGWLVEKMVNGNVHYISANYVLEWTHDPNKALRLARREDAEALCTIVEDADKIAQHEWPIPTQPPAHTAITEINNEI